MDIDALTRALVRFRDERDWAQFHTLRNLIVSLNLEAAELLELTQWKSDAEMAALPEDAAGMEALRDECADVPALPAADRRTRRLRPAARRGGEARKERAEVSGGKVPRVEPQVH